MTVIKTNRDGAVQIEVKGDGSYAVVVVGMVTFSSRVLSAAEIYYQEEVDKRDAGRKKRLAIERADLDVQALRAEWSARSREAKERGSKPSAGA